MRIAPNAKYQRVVVLALCHGYYVQMYEIPSGQWTGVDMEAQTFKLSDNYILPVLQRLGHVYGIYTVSQ